MCVTFFFLFVRSFGCAWNKQSNLHSHSVLELKTTIELASCSTCNCLPIAQTKQSCARTHRHTHSKWHVNMVKREYAQVYTTPNITNSKIFAFNRKIYISLRFLVSIHWGGPRNIPATNQALEMPPYVQTVHIRIYFPVLYRKQRNCTVHRALNHFERFKIEAWTMGNSFNVWLMIELFGRHSVHIQCISDDIFQSSFFVSLPFHCERTIGIQCPATDRPVSTRSWWQSIHLLGIFARIFQ